MEWSKIRNFDIKSYNDFSIDYESEFNLVFSAERDCRPSFYLKQFGLRKTAFPLDWQFGYTIDTLIHLLKTDFSDFFMQVKENEEKSRKMHNRYVIDTKNNIISMHHFSKEISLSEGHKMFLEIMSKRAQCLKEAIQKSQSVLMVGDWHESVDKLKTFMKSFDDVYSNCEKTLINIRHNNVLPMGMIHGDIYKSNYGIIYDFEINDINCKGGGESWKGNETGWGAVLKNVHLKKFYKESITNKCNIIGKEKTMMDFESLSLIVKDFCARYERIYVYGKGYTGMHAQDFLMRNKIKISGFVSQNEGGICGTLPIKSIDTILSHIEKCGIVVVVWDNEKKEIEKRFRGKDNFLYIMPNILLNILINSRTVDGKVHLCDWVPIGNIENDWWVKYIRHYYSNLDEKIYFYSVYGSNHLVRDPRDGIKIFYSGECLGDVENYFRNPKKSNFDHCLPYVDISLAFENVDAMNYMRFPYWIRRLFTPETTLKEIKDTIDKINHSHYKISDACACICRHDNWNTRTMVYENVKDLFEVKFAGPWNNNTDELFKKFGNNKIEYLKHFCFNICAENMNSEGYVTEKIFDAFLSDAIPLYHGALNNPEPQIINHNAVIFFDKKSNNEESRKLIKDLLANKKMYQEFIEQPKIYPEAAEYIYEHYFLGLKKRFDYVINRYKKQKRAISFLGTKPIKPFVYERLDKITDYTIERSDENQFNFYRYDKLLPNRRYNIHLSNIVADFDEFTMGLYDFKERCKIQYENFSTLSEIDFNFDTKEDVSQIALCIYAGISGDTKGKSMTIGSIEVIAASLADL